MVKLHKISFRSIQSHQIEHIKEQNILKVPIYKPTLSNCLFNVKPPIYKPKDFVSDSLLSQTKNISGCQKMTNNHFLER